MTPRCPGNRRNLNPQNSEAVGHAAPQAPLYFAQLAMGCTNPALISLLGSDIYVHCSKGKINLVIASNNCAYNYSTRRRTQFITGVLVPVLWHSPSPLGKGGGELEI